MLGVGRVRRQGKAAQRPFKRADKINPAEALHTLGAFCEPFMINRCTLAVAATYATCVNQSSRNRHHHPATVKLSIVSTATLLLRVPPCRRRRYKEALRMFEAQVIGSPSSSAAHLNAGLALYQIALLEAEK